MKYLKYILFGFLFMFIFKIDVLAYGVDCHYDVDDWATCDIKYNGVDDPEISCERINAGWFSSYIFTYPQFVSLKSLMNSEEELVCPPLYARQDGDNYSISIYRDLVAGGKSISASDDSMIDNSNEPERNYDEIYCAYNSVGKSDYLSFFIRRNKESGELTYANAVYEGPENGSIYNFSPEFRGAPDFLNTDTELTCPAADKIQYGINGNNRLTIVFPDTDASDLNPYNEETVVVDTTDRNADTNGGFGIYLAYNFNSKVRRLSLRQQGDGYELVLDGTSKVSINNLNDCDRPDDEVDWLTAINNRDEDNYPTYVIQTNDGYYFADYKPSTGSYLNFFIFYEHLYEAQIDNDLTNTCQIIVGDNFLTFLNNNVFRVIYIGVPIILILLTSFDFAKVVFIDDKEGIQKAGKRFGKRVIVAVLIYLVPTILIFISNLIGVESIDDCVKQLEHIVEEESS